MAVGSIDGTHIKIMPPNARREDYINHKLFYSINMQAVCDHRGVFMDIFAGYPGSVHDARVLKCSPLYRQRGYPPEGYYIVGDSAYPCQSRPLAILTPYKAAITPVQARYNYHLSRARTIVERAFGQMKTRWRSIFTKTLEISPVLAPKVAGACAIMHKVCILSGDEWGEEAEDDEDYPPNEQPDI
ncbi:putative nuclease HARBI1 [Asterias rubens]|uniref:putative nuclease HARBI1 n=1 Tax=Asterias rubens TaxID=7604 RepID=UPI001455BA30|nr:putative nuclease HARBI1 [Asterias rubens]